MNSTSNQTHNNGSGKATLTKPGIYTFNHLPAPYNIWGWNKLDEVHAAAIDAATQLPPDLAFDITDNLGEFMRNYWQLCHITSYGIYDQVTFCDGHGIAWTLSLDEVSSGIDETETDLEKRKDQEHPIFQGPIKRNAPLYVPALFGRIVPTIASKGGESVHAGVRIAKHFQGALYAAGALLIRIAAKSKLHQEEAFIQYDPDWGR